MEVPPEDLRQSAATGVFWSAVQTWGSQLISLVVFVVLARLLAPVDFGLVALATVYLAFVQIFLDQGFADAIVQREKLEKAHLDTAFWATIGIALVLLAIAFATAGLIAGLFSEDELAPVIRWLSLTFVVGALASVQQAILRRALLFKRLAVRSLIATVCGGIAGLTLAASGFGVWSLVGQQLVGGFAGVVVLWAASPWRPGRALSRRHFRELWSFGINIVGMNFLNFFNRRSDDLLIGYFLGPVALGFYTVGYRMLRIVTKVVANTMTQVAFPTFSRLQTQPDRMRRAFYSATQLTSLIAFPAFIALAVLAPEFVETVYGEQWAPSATIMQILAFIGILHASYYFNRSVILGAGRPTWALALATITAVANVVAFSIAVHWGIVAVAIAYVARAYLFSPLPLIVVHRIIGLDVRAYLGQFAVPLAGSLVMAAVMLGARELAGSASVFLISATLAGAASYLVTVRILSPAVFARAVDLTRIGLPTVKWRRA